MAAKNLVFMRVALDYYNATPTKNSQLFMWLRVFNLYEIEPEASWVSSPSGLYKVTQKAETILSLLFEFNFV